MAVLNKIRLSKGWGILAPEDAEIQARAWSELLQTVPANAINELYLLAMETRARAISAGREPIELSADAFLGLWSGPNGLRDRLPSLKALNAATGDAIANCPDCFGSGLKYHRDPEGRVKGVGGICEHGRLGDE